MSPTRVDIEQHLPDGSLQRFTRIKLESFTVDIATACKILGLTKPSLIRRDHLLKPQRLACRVGVKGNTQRVYNDSAILRAALNIGGFDISPDDKGKIVIRNESDGIRSKTTLDIDYSDYFEEGESLTK